MGNFKEGRPEKSKNPEEKLGEYVREL